MIYKDVRIRAFEPEDLELLYNWENNRLYWAISNTINPFSKYTLKRYVEISHKSIYETGQIRLMIDYVPDNVSVGSIDIFDFDPFHLRAGIGILIADEKYRRKGLASMAITWVIDYCFKNYQLHQLYCNILADNHESIQLFSKLGFVQVGTRKEWVKTPTGYIDQHIFQLINKD